MRRLLARSAGLALVVALSSRLGAQPSPWSPDGSWIAYVLAPDPSPASAETTLRWLLEVPPPEDQSDSSPPPSREALWATQPDTGESVVLDQVDGFLTDPAWAPDGRSMAHGRLTAPGSGQPLRFELVVQPAPERQRVLASWPWRRSGSTLDDECRRSVAWSGDGAWLVAPDPEADGLVLVEAATGRVRRRLPGAVRPAWSPDATRLAFLRPDDPPRLEVLDGPDSEPVLLGIPAGIGPPGFPPPAWDPDGALVNLLAPAGAEDGPVRLRIERFRLAPPGPEPARLLNEPARDALAPDASASVAFLEDGEAIYAGHGLGRSDLLTWIRGDRGEVYKRFHPFLEGVPIHSVALNPRPGASTLALRLGPAPRALPPALCDPLAESFLPLVPDAAARSAWQGEIRAAIQRLLDELTRPIPSVRPEPAPRGPSRLPLPGTIDDRDPSAKRLRRLARLGDSLLCLDLPSPPDSPAHRTSEPVDAVLFSALLDRPGESLAALDALEPDAVSPELRHRLIGLRAHLAIASGERARAAGVLGYLDEAGPGSGRLILEADARPRFGDPFPTAPLWLANLRRALDGALRPSRLDADLPRYDGLESGPSDRPEVPPDPFGPVPIPPRPGPPR
jgi:hypothetical protein